MRIAGLYPQKVNRGPHREIEFLEPLGLEYVLAQVADQHEVKLFTLFGKTERQVVQEIIDYHPQVLAVSAMTPQIKLGLKMAGEVKRKSPEIISIFGGYHPTAIPEIIFKEEVDLVLQNEGERRFAEAINHPKKIRDLTNVAWKDKMGPICREGVKDRITDLDSLADPIRPDFLEQLRDHGHRYPAALIQTGMASVSYSRGCLFNCAFCSSPAMYGKGITYRSVGRVIAEMQKLNQERGINSFFFTDLNFTANPDKTKELCQGIINSGMQIYWECLSNIATADSPLLKTMRQAGCRKIGWGIESLNPQVVQAMGKRGLDKTYEVLQSSEDVGIVNTGFYIIGHPSETEQDILRNTRALDNLPIHRLRVTVYTPLPGSRSYEETNPKNSDFDLYDTTHLVFNHPTLFQNDIDRLRKKITRDFYASPAYKARVTHLVKEFPEYAEVFNPKP